MTSVEIKNKEISWDSMNLDYSGENNLASFLPSKKNTHPYPAKLVPELVSELMGNICINNQVETVLDPFVGSGTTALESHYLGLNFIGTDLNPLAILIARTKVLRVDNIKYLNDIMYEFLKDLKGSYSVNMNVANVDFKNINYWFKKENIHQLSYMKSKINDFLESQDLELIETFGLILLNAMSSCVKASSLSRNNEFKLYRITPNDIEKFNVNSIDVYLDKVISLLEIVKDTNTLCRHQNDIRIDLRNAKNIDFIEDGEVDLIITSPPYGDSRSTVAYGQFSRLPLQWVGDLMNKYLKIPVISENCDEMLLGGKQSDIDIDTPIILAASPTLRDLFNEIDCMISIEIELLHNISQELQDVFLKIQEGKPLKKEMISTSLFELISERVRLDYVRKFNEEAVLTSKEIKHLSIQRKEEYLSNLFDETNDGKIDEIEIFTTKLIRVRETIKRKLKSVPQRKEEVVSFFKDLYQVMLETDRALKTDGIQIWVVGHRTILGKVQINMKEILNDWFNYLEYNKVTDLTRQYSFKRLPHHINSTINRSDKISTMMYEHILIVKKR